MPEDWETPPPSLGSASVSASGDEGRVGENSGTRWELYVGNLWIPDIDQRHGWRDYWIRRQQPIVDPSDGWQGLVR